MKYWLMTIVILGSSASLRSQEYTYERDTSYTIRSAYQKIKKDYPFVTVVEPGEYKGIRSERDQVYSHTGRDLTLDVFYPEKNGGDPVPGVLLIYGGGWSSGEKANQVPMAQYLASHGYVAVVVEYRLSPEAKYPAAVEDIGKALSWMRRHADEYGLDPGRIAALGCSAGAQLATLVGMKGKGEQSVGAVVNIDGIVSFIHPEAEEGKYAAKWLGGTREESFELWKEASPLEYAGENSPPVLFVNSSHPRFHAGRDDMIGILNEYGIYTEVHELKDSPHSFWHVHPWFDTTATLTREFLDKVFEVQRNLK